ncbi:unnamed protein product, partial [Rotaria socialis]
GRRGRSTSAPRYFPERQYPPSPTYSTPMEIHIDSETKLKLLLSLNHYHSVLR